MSIMTLLTTRTLRFNSSSQLFLIDDKFEHKKFDGILGQWTGVHEILASPHKDPFIIEKWDFWNDFYGQMTFLMGSPVAKRTLQMFEGKYVRMATRKVKVGSSPYWWTITCNGITSIKEKV